MPFLDWVNKNQAVQASNQVPYHLLQHQDTYGDATTARDNLLIQGDNLQALKALLPFYTGKVKCIFIDPPYNTQSAFEHYDDKLEHSQWFSMMYPRLVLLRELLAEDGSIWVTLDDREAHYFKVMMDEVFGRNNFVANVVWQSSDNSNNDAKQFSTDHNHVLIFSKSIDWRPNKISDDLSKRSHFKNPDNDPKGSWFDGNPLNSPSPRPNLTFDLISPTGFIISPPKNGWRWSKETIEEKLSTGEIRFTEDGKNIKRRTYLSDMDGLPPSTLWADIEITGHNRQAKSEIKKLFDDLFSTPKPEKLLNHILHIATNENDLILDSFLGSGTTAAVAHKMNRRYIGIEMGAHAVTHCIPRLQKVIEGEQGGISKAVNWTGGGGFSFFTLGAPVFDAEGHITPEVRFNDLAAYIWWLETKSPYKNGGAKPAKNTPFIGECDGVAYYLLYNGILGDRRPNGGNVLTSNVLEHLLESHPHVGKKVIFGEASRLGVARLAENHIEFKQIPYELHDRV